MSDSDKSKKDITRIENLSDFNHGEEDEFISFEETALKENEDFSYDSEKENLDESFNSLDEEIKFLDQDENELEENFFDDQLSKENNIDEQLQKSNESPSEGNDLDISNLDKVPDNDSNNNEIIDLKSDLDSDLEQLDNAYIPEHIEIENTPSFSLLIENIATQYEKDEIKRMLREIDFITDENSEALERSIENGKVIIPYISEYIGIFLAHKLRIHNFDLKLDLSESFGTQIDELQKGPLNVITLKQNKISSYDSEAKIFGVNDIIITTTSSFETHKIEKYHGPVIAERNIDLADYPKNVIELPISESETKEFSLPGLKEIYLELTEELKQQACFKKSNGLIDLKFETLFLKEDNLYKIMATATIVYITEK